MPVIRKPINLLMEPDLQHLISKGVEEGLFLEYKRALPSQPLKLAKIVASFANTHGGHIVVGMESDKTTNKPTSLCGISCTGTLKESVMQTCFQNINPMPVFRTAIIDIANSPGQCALIIDVPESLEPPHFVQGTIYVRNLEASDPVDALKHYHLIEKLYAKRASREAQKSKLKPFHERSQLRPGSYDLQLAVVPVLGDTTFPIYSRTFVDWLQSMPGKFEYSPRPAPRLHRRTGGSMGVRESTIWQMGLSVEHSSYEYADGGEGRVWATELFGRELTQSLNSLATLYQHEEVQYYGPVACLASVNCLRGAELIHADRRTRSELPNGLHLVTTEFDIFQLSDPAEIETVRAEIELQLRRKAGEHILA